MFAVYLLQSADQKACLKVQKLKNERNDTYVFFKIDSLLTQETFSNMENISVIRQMLHTNFLIAECPHQFDVLFVIIR